MHAAKYIRSLNKLVTGNRCRLSCLCLHQSKGYLPAGVILTVLLCHEVSNRETHTDTIASGMMSALRKRSIAAFRSPSVLRASPVDT